jgi:hypothetical protein
MKSKIAAVFVIVLLAQKVHPGEIKAMIGLNSSKYLFSSKVDALILQQKTGLGIGFGYAFELSQNLKLEINTFYNQKGAKASIEYTPSKTVFGFYRNTTIGFPILLKYQFKNRKLPYAAIGPEFNIIIAHHFKIPETKDDYDLSADTRKFVLAFNALLGYEIPFDQWGLFAELRYNRWLSDFFDVPEAAMKGESFSFLLGGVYYL